MLWNPLKEDPSTNSDENMSALLIKTYEGAHGYGILDLCIASDNTKFATVVCNVNSDYIDSISISLFFLLYLFHYDELCIYRFVAVLTGWG